MSRAELERRWLELTRAVLPGLAAERRWPVRNNHCFQRILLDNACGRVWYSAVRKRPAYRHIDAAILAAAVALGEQVLGHASDLAILNAQSLKWRKP